MAKNEKEKKKKQKNHPKKLDHLTIFIYLVHSSCT